MSTQRRLIYFADPMCSWCWGFSPVIGKIVEEFSQSLPVTLVMGGLRAGNEKPMDAVMKAEIGEHWRSVERLSGQPFNHEFFKQDGYVYDTAPACRAVIAARQAFPGRELGLLAFLQEAFYVRGFDLTREDVLIGLAADYGFERSVFSAAISASACEQELKADLVAAMANGIRAFPALLGGSDEDRYMTVTHGWRAFDEIAPTLKRLSTLPRLPEGFMPGPAHLPAR